ncbi:hypothetical protein CCR85_11295 [Rhodothalassium salexigens]|uniref:hypothetical protein n=1 Tax=Rhodothalassium salexigens TaxID=1086 RepID=UPI0019144C74|nr:hypothetical protein [Rhodothalassium salexigens]MBK5912074.1 hypothetical protein [Rhodothalassium salexigens]
MGNHVLEVFLLSVSLCGFASATLILGFLSWHWRWRGLPLWISLSCAFMTLTLLGQLLDLTRAAGGLAMFVRLCFPFYGLFLMIGCVVEPAGSPVPGAPRAGAAGRMPVLVAATAVLAGALALAARTWPALDLGFFLWNAGLLGVCAVALLAQARRAPALYGVLAALLIAQAVALVVLGIGYVNRLRLPVWEGLLGVLAVGLAAALVLFVLHRRTTATAAMMRQSLYAKRVAETAYGARLGCLAAIVDGSRQTLADLDGLLALPVEGPHRLDAEGFARIAGLGRRYLATVETALSQAKLPEDPIADWAPDRAAGPDAADPDRHRARRR